MSKVTDDDERRRRSLEAGREMLEKYKAERINKAKGPGHSQTDDASDEESFRIDKSIGRRESYMHEGVSSRDVTQSSVSMSEGEADGDLEGLAGRVAQLEEMLQGKEAIVEALHAEIDHLRAEASSPNSSQSQNSSIHGKDIISLYHTKLQEFEKAINKRDNLIEELTWSLQQALSARDNLVTQLSSLNAVQIPDKGRAGTVNSANMQDKIDALEATLSNQRSIIEKLNGQLIQSQERERTLEMERETRNAEISDYKLQINNLNEQIRLGATDKNLNIAETLEQQKKYEARVDKIKQDMQHILEKFTTETNINTARHQQELKEVAAKHETEIMNIQEMYEERLKQFKDENKVLADRLNKDLPDLETRHAKELSIFQAQMGHYKKTVEALKLELVNRSESQQTAQAELSQCKAKVNELKVQYENAHQIQELEHQKEREMLGEQIKLHKLQLEDITSKYVAATAILESKESIERSLEQALTNAATLKDENDSLKFKLDDLSSRYTAAQSLIENTQVHERTLSNRIFDLEKSLSRLSGINLSTFSGLNETAYQSLDEVAIQFHLTKQKLEEKAELEKLLIDKIENLEGEVRKTTEELEQANLARKSYEKQLKDTRNMCDKYKSELNSLKSLDTDGQSCSRDLFEKTEKDQQEIKQLKINLEQKEAELADSLRQVQDLSQKFQKSDEECQQLKNGLATAWAQCAEVEEKLNQTLALNESKLDSSVPMSSHDNTSTMRIKFNRTVNDTTTLSIDDTHDQSRDDNRLFYGRDDDSSDTTGVVASLQAKLASTLQENERLAKELERSLEAQLDYNRVKEKPKHYSTSMDNSIMEKHRVEEEEEEEEEEAPWKELRTAHSLKESVNQLRAEKELLRKEIDALICVHDKQINAIKVETASEIRKVQSLVSGVKDGTAELRDLKTELEMRHAKEMEELRTYFEQKCLLMEKQYSEEIFSQQSKKMSDNDSEIADLTESLYFGGAGDCMNVSNNLSERSSRVASPLALALADEQSKHNTNGLNKYELETTVKALQQELQNKIIEVQEVKLHYEKKLEEQKMTYEGELYGNRREPEKLEFLRNMVTRIEAADKQLKATRRFLDEQASEREVERDEAAKQIHLLQGQLKEREREKGRDLRITSEQSTLSPEPTSEVPVLQTSDINATVEALESQMREMSSLMSDTEARKIETESELKAAIDKIWVLRDIITDLEQQLQSKSEKEESLQLQIGQLETVIAAQTKNQQELVQELDTVKMGSESKQLNEHINHLQEELRKHKLSSEQFNANSTALKQMKSELREMQIQLDKRIKELESIHMCSSNLSLSQPSEDVSIREQIDAARCPTPDDPNSPPMLPLDQLLKLKEKMSKHARAEEVAFKRIKDLEMQVAALKNQNEELQAEQEILQQTTSEQLYQIEAMRGRLEQHKQNAPFAQRQATSRLELQLHEANTKFQSLESAVAEKDLELRDTLNQLDRVSQLLQEKESEIANVVQVERSTIQKLREHLEIVEEENRILQAKVGVQEHSQLELPRLIDSMLADKNEEIDHMKDQLSKKDKQLQLYSSLNLDETQLRELIRQTEPKNSARTLSDILSIHSECEETSEAVRGTNFTQTLPSVSTLRIPTAFVSAKIMDDTAALSPLDSTATSTTGKIGLRVPPLDLGSRSQSLSAASNQQSSEMDLLQPAEPTSRNSEENDGTPMNDSEKKNEYVIVDDKVDDKVDGKVDDESLVRSVCVTPRVKHVETSINEYIEEMEKLEHQLEIVREELRTKSEILAKREADLLSLQKLYNELQTEVKEVVETLTTDKCFYQNQYELSKTSENKIKKDLLEVENVLKLKTAEVQEQKCKIQVNEKIIMELSSENGKLKADIKEKEQQHANKCASLLRENAHELETMRSKVLRQDKQLNELKTKNELLKQEIVECQREMTEGLNNRDQTIRRLEEMVRRVSFSEASSPSNEKDEEIHHLQEYLKEKDKVIRQMNDDSKSLHRALETIQNKMKESGNVVELRRKLREEQKLNAELRNAMDKLNKELSDLKLATQRSQEDTDIEDMVQRELNLSAHLDRRLMNAIETDQEDGICKVENQVQTRGPRREGVQRSSELKLQLSQANRINDELKKLKDDLEIERGMLKCQIAEYEGRIFQLKSDLAMERKQVAKLNEELFAEKSLIRSLKIQIEKEHRSMESGHVQDSELIEFLQNKLKTSLDNEARLRNDLSLLRQEHKSLEIQLSLMKEHVQSQQSQKSDELPKLADLLETERKKYLSVMESLEKEERNSAELKDTLRKLQSEKNRFEKQLEVEVEEKEKLISSLALVEGIRDHLQTDLGRTKEELKAREEECEWLQKRIKTTSDAEIKRQEQRTSEQNQLKGLRREINNAREVMVDLEADMKQLREREMKLTETVESLREKETYLLKELSAAKDEETKLRDTIAELQQELRSFAERELELARELKNRYGGDKTATPTKLLQKIKELGDINKKYLNEKSMLQEKLVKALEDKEQLGQRVKSLESRLKRGIESRDANAAIGGDCADKLQHFYGKYIRADSRRKALTYQKRYLLTIVSGYQISEENTLSILAQLTSEQRSYTTAGRHKKSPRVRFKSAALVLISIHRMKWLIVRWSIGRRIGAQTLLWNVDQSYVPVQKLAMDHSPPVRERPVANEDGNFDGFALAQYYQRLKNIQQTLGLAMAESVNRQIHPE
ncbi:uncharacterized protein LOC117226934 isoform X8 [Megalopta genalis]|uniref:uncharacterized protein LOC117226934 isoform X8 n=1 Tax=Megalopta genalis TaxID=115081 RepID=UPI003FD053BD